MKGSVKFFGPKRGSPRGGEAIEAALERLRQAGYGREEAMGRLAEIGALAFLVAQTLPKREAEPPVLPLFPLQE